MLLINSLLQQTRASMRSLESTSQWEHRYVIEQFFSNSTTGGLQPLLAFESSIAIASLLTHWHAMSQSDLYISGI